MNQGSNFLFGVFSRGGATKGSSFSKVSQAQVLYIGIFQDFEVIAAMEVL